MDIEKLEELLDDESLRMLNGIKTMLSRYDLKLKIIPSNHENVFYFGIEGKGKSGTLVQYREEFVLDKYADFSDLTEDFAVAFYELFSTADLMNFVISTLDKVHRIEGIKFTNATLASYDLDGIQITTKVTDELLNYVGDCSFMVNMERRGVDVYLYLDNLEVKTCSLSLSGIHKDVNVEITPVREITNFNDYLPNDFEFDIDINVRKHFDGLTRDYVQKACKIIKNAINVYNMIKEN